MAGRESRTLYDRALDVLPGGVNSSVRAAVRPYPFFVERGDGGRVIDADGPRRPDFVMRYGPLLLGHGLPGAEVFQAGTFSGHPVTMAAGIETLRYAARENVFEHVNALGEQLRAGLTDIVADTHTGADIEQALEAYREAV